MILIKEHLVNKGLLIVLTGDGKGKTSAALGIALRAYGHNMSICVIQFIKGSFVTGESLAAEKLGIEFVSLGKGFVIAKGSELNLKEHRSAAEKALTLARERMLSGALNILILDEINNAVKLGLLDIAAVLDLVKSKPQNLHLVLTGRNAHPDLIAAADLVTEMHALKHPFDSGLPAQKGIDY